MRGFAMLLVVMGHIYFSYDVPVNSVVTDGSAVSFVPFFTMLHMPVFFFISGFILYSGVQKWQGWGDCRKFLSKKAVSLLIPTVFFFSAFVLVMGRDWRFAIFHESKLGYWFTPMLFVFFCLYAAHHMLSKKLRLSAWQNNAAACVFALFCFYFSQTGTCVRLMGSEVYTLLCTAKFQFYIFFLSGILARKYYPTMEGIIIGRRSSALLVGSFFLTSVPFYAFGQHLAGGGGIFILFITVELIVQILGILMIFSFFHRYETSLSKETKLGRMLQYIGQRTLDIYMLHFFFQPLHLGFIGSFFEQYDNPTLEFTLTLFIALIDVAFSLVVSSALRVSPFLAHHLFGEKYREKG